MGISIILLSLALTMLFIPVYYYADARESFQDIGIVLSRSCMTMIQNDLPTNCPTYEEIMIIHPDTSNHVVSGGFTMIDNMLQREKGVYDKHFGWYEFKPKNVWIDPPADIRHRIKLITIENNLNEYPINGVSHKVNDTRTITLGTDRYVDPNSCYKASINADNWFLLVGDTMHFMEHDCDPAYTTFDHLKVIDLGMTEQDISTSYKYQLEKWISETKIKCKELCREY